MSALPSNRPQLCLTEAELEELTETPQPSLQMKWLDENRWPYVLGRRGRPKVARALAEQKLGVAVAANDAQVQTAPDWSEDTKG